MRHLTMTLAAICLAGAAWATDQDDLRAAAIRYVTHPVQQKMMDDMLSADAIMAQMRAVLPEASEEDLAIVAGIAVEELARVRPALESAMIEAAVRSFTLEEMLALEAFYSTEPGASVMAKMQPFMAEAWAQMGPEMGQMQARIGQLVQEALANR